MPVDYQNGKIYLIRSKESNDAVYVGSTVQKLCVRWAGHKRSCKNTPQRRIYKYMNENGGADKFYIEHYENYPCNSKEELEKREYEVMREFNLNEMRLQNVQYYQKSKCIHECQAYRCPFCNGPGICPHGNEKYYCSACGGKGICIHKRKKYSCYICKPKNPKN